jgi:hypothetical protein
VRLFVDFLALLCGTDFRGEPDLVSLFAAAASGRFEEETRTAISIQERTRLIRFMV